MMLPSRRHRHLRMGFRRPAMAIVAMTILAACSAPTLRAPSPSAPLAATFSNEKPAASLASALDDAWWDGFGDATLAALVRQALSANQDVAMALQRVGQARAGAEAQASRLWPTLGVQAAASRSQSGVPEPVKQGLPD